MTTRASVLSILLSAGCVSTPSASDSEALLEDYEAAVAAVHEVTDGYVADVLQGADVASITDRQATYQTDLGLAMDGVEHVLGELDGCEMMDEGLTLMDDARGSMQIITDDLDAMLLAHEEHTDVADCQDAASEHAGVVDGEVETMESYHDTWHDMDMTCAMHDEGEEMAL